MVRPIVSTGKRDQGRGHRREWATDRNPPPPLLDSFRVHADGNVHQDLDGGLIERSSRYKSLIVIRQSSVLCFGNRAAF
jgi:hypothetical protein